MIGIAATLALSLALADAPPAARPEVIFELAPELGSAQIGHPHFPGPAVGVHAAGLVTVKGPVSLGLSFNGYDLPGAYDPVYCPVGFGPCASANGYYAVRGGPAVRVTKEFGRVAALVQMSPQYELQLLHFPTVRSGPSSWESTSYFAFEAEAGGDIWIWRQVAVGPRFCFSAGPGTFSWGLGAALSIRAP